MKASWNWLTDYAAAKARVAEVAERLTMAGLTVESIEETPEDFILEVEITSNRPDWLCHIGIAREIAALYGVPLRIPDVALVEGGGRVEEAAGLEVPDADLCPLYTGRVIRGVKIAPSPQWLAERMEAMGLRSVNNVVDITNYVMYECGQPLHAFDLAGLAGAKVIVRRAVKGEPVTLIDGAKHTLTDADLVIADERKPVAIAGIMGGLESEIGEQTADIFLESAKFDQLSVRTTAKRLAISTDASYRFERGVDMETVDWASRRAAQLIVKLAGGTLCEGVLAVGAGRGGPPVVKLRMSHLKRLTGMEIPIEEARAILASLGFVLRGGSPDETLVEVPSFRGDVTEEIDLVEEVLRVYGYDRIPFATGQKIGVGRVTGRERLCEAVEAVLTGSGFYGCVSYSLATAQLFKAISPWTGQPPVCIEGRAGREQTFLRASLVGSLLLARKTNEDRKVARPDLYEIAHIYLPSEDELPEQPLMMAAVTGGDFYELKGVVERLLSAVGADAEFTARDYDFLTPGEAAAIVVDGRSVGFIGRIAEPIRAGLDLREDATVVEIRISDFEELSHVTRSFAPLQRFPGVERDLAVVVAEEVRWADVVACVEGAGLTCLDSISFASVYRGEPIPQGKKSIAFHVTFRSPERTLTGGEADEAQGAVVGALAESLGASLR